MAGRSTINSHSIFKLGPTVRCPWYLQEVITPCLYDISPTLMLFGSDAIHPSERTVRMAVQCVFEGDALAGRRAGYVKREYLIDVILGIHWPWSVLDDP